MLGAATRRCSAHARPRGRARPAARRDAAESAETRREPRCTRSGVSSTACPRTTRTTRTCRTATTRAEMVGLPLDDFVYDVYAYDATADVEPRRVSTSRDHGGAQSLPDDLSRTVDCESLASRAMTPGGDTLSSSGESEDDDGLSTRCVVSPRRRSRAAPLVVGIRHPLRDVLALPRTNEDDPAGTDGDDDVSSLGADDNDRNKSADDLSADGARGRRPQLPVTSHGGLGLGAALLFCWREAAHRPPPSRLIVETMRGRPALLDSIAAPLRKAAADGPPVCC